MPSVKSLRSGRSRINLTMDTVGPLFTPGQVDAVMRQFMDETKDEVAQTGLRLLRARFGSTFKHPTGRYESRVVIDRAGRESDRVITDHFVIYGSWLEGSSSRNQSTKFKGYQSFRKVRLQVRRLVTPIAQEKLDSFLRRLQ